MYLRENSHVCTHAFMCVCMHECIKNMFIVINIDCSNLQSCRTEQSLVKMIHFLLSCHYEIKNAVEGEKLCVALAFIPVGEAMLQSTAFHAMVTAHAGST